MASPALSRLIAKLFARPESRRDRRRAARLGVEQLESRDVPTGTIAGRIWLDLNNDWVQDSNEPGIPDVLIEALDNTMSVAASDTTDADGYFEVTGVPDDSCNSVVTLPTGSPYSFGQTGSGITTIMWPTSQSSPAYIPVYASPPPPVVSVTRVNDAVEGVTAGLFRFARTGPTTNALTASYLVPTIGPGYANPGGDYAALPGSVTFDLGMATVDVEVVAYQDNIAEYAESVQVVITEGTGYEPAESGASVWIWEDASLLPPEVTVSGVADAVEGGAPGVLRFGRTGSTTSALTVTYTLGTGPQEATPGDDYTLLYGEVTIPAGKSFEDITVTAVDDAVSEETELVTATIQAPPGYEVGDAGTGVVRIADTDSQTGIIGGFVWDDTNEDGIQDGTELGRAGEPVTLLDASSTPLYVVLTAADGSYGFGGLVEGTYQLQFSQPLLHNFTLQDQGTDDTLDSDADPVTGITAAIALTQASPTHLIASAGLVLQRPVQTDGVRVVIMDKNGNEVSALKVAKWYQSFQLDPLVPRRAIVRSADANGEDFIDKDVDRFGVRVYDPVAYNAVPEVPYVDVTLGTGHLLEYMYANDDPTTIRLVKMGGVWGAKFPGWYISDSQMLVSNKVDDEYMGPGTSNVVHTDDAAPNPTSQRRNRKIGLEFPITDRTHKALAGAAVNAAYNSGRVDAFGNPIVSATTAAVAFNGTVNLHISNLRVAPGNTAAPAVTIQDIENDLKYANEALAQVGIRVRTSGAPQVRSTPSGVDLRNKFDPSTTQLASLVGYVGPPADPYRTPTGANGRDDIEVYYINDFLNPLQSGLTVLDATNAAGTGTSIIISTARYYTTLSHEILHVLWGQPGHVGGETLPPNYLQRLHLLVRGSEAIIANNVIDSRRINDLTESQMFMAGKNNVIQ